MNSVLVVDDEVDICLLLSGILKREGYDTSFALSLADAEARLKQTDFNLVFLDLNLTDGVGYDLIPIIRNKSDVKIVVVSAYDSEARKAIQEGADYFVSKPFRKSDILEAIAALDER